MKSQLLRPERVPARKPLNEHKQPLSVSIEPENRQWIREHWKELGFRSESHLVDEALRQFRERADKASKSPRE